MVLTHTLDRGVLIVLLHGDIVISERAAVSQQFAEVVRMHAPQAVVVELRTPVVSPAALSAILRAHRLCAQAGMPLSVVATSGVARRLLEAGTAGTGLRVFGRRAQAVASASVAAPA